ncbi:ABC transporter ATP-binding protein [Streptomyces sp. SAI-127]|uniref:ABC transporter ATP-binding protein n=1 Tax=Streptomyces sp. SAI-127 TaxID=2940543 RepID=UPI002475DA35|nr:ABC transporter ATP-binding protein [Streptomyces sp. SAI-127]MDH6492291.1 ATP-binding cassette subfamily B protein [Streptomyces sp. SAI-127]
MNSHDAYEQASRSDAPTFKDRAGLSVSRTRKAWRSRGRLLLFLRHGGPFAVPCLIVVVLANALLPGVNALLAGHLTRTISARLSNPHSSSGSSTTVLLVGLGGVLLLGHVLEAAKSVLERGIAQRLDGWLRSDIRRLALSPETIAHLEDSALQADIVRASDIGPANQERERSPGMAATAQLSLAGRLLSAVIAAVVMAVAFSWALAATVLAAALLTRTLLRRQWLYLARAQDGAAPIERRTRYWTSVLSEGTDAKEVRLYGLSPHFVHLRYQEAQQWIDTYLTVLRGVLGRQHWTLILAGGSVLIGMLLPGLAALAGRISIATLTTCLVSMWAILSISFIGREAYDIEIGLRGFEATSRLRRRGREWSASETGRLPLLAERPAIRFEAVSFHYPGSPHKVFDGLTLDVRPGEVTAIVGGNGVGKTTLIKLLAGLYRPTGGRILLDGQDLTSVRIDDWRRRLTVVFQDFVRYPLSVADNVWLSAPEQDSHEAELLEAVRRSGAEDVLSHLPAGVETSLWSAGTSATGLSGGQWQQLAIARSLYAMDHERTCLILDEPTAHLDPHAEADFYQRVVQSVPSATVILISHRMSTIRNADRILLLQDGQLAENGSHSELMAAGGEYARLFKLQASRFQAQRANS